MTLLQRLVVQAATTSTGIMSCCSFPHPSPLHTPPHQPGCDPCAHPQTKETLTIKASSFGSKCELTSQFMDKVAKCGVMDNILSFAAFKNQKELKKSDGAKRSRLTGRSRWSLE